MRGSHDRKTTIFKVIIFALLFISIITLIFLFQQNKPKEITFSEFQTMLDKNEITKITYDDMNDADLIATTIYHNDVKFPNPNSPTFKEEMLNKNIVFTQSITRKIAAKLKLVSLIFSLLIAVFTLIIIVKMYSPSLSRGFKVNKKNVGDIRFKDIAGNKEAIKELKTIYNIIKNVDNYKKQNIRLPKGIILYGDPGVGKTLLAKALANESNTPFFYVNGSDFGDMFAGVGKAKVNKIFSKARKEKSAIVFIDEIDAIGIKRTGGGAVETDRSNTLNAILVEMDGFNKRGNIFVMASTNRLEELDPALTRKGRFDKLIKISKPNLEERIAILKLYMKNKKFSEDVDIKNLAQEIIGFTGADIETLINEAAIISIESEKDFIDKEDIEEALYKVLTNGNKRAITSNNEEKRIIAWHEAAHAVANKVFNVDIVNRVTIIPSSSGVGGFTSTYSENDKFLYSKDYLISKIKVLYAGRIGEILSNSQKEVITTGARDDIKRATDMIKKMISEYGMGENGLLDAVELTNDNKILLEESKKISQKIYNDTFSTLRDNIKIIQELANLLLEKETIYREDIDGIFDKYNI
ncbi:ATP-dependent metallopeptidase FtsH/Yme1/Tma family protein [Clostridium perfringens]